MWYIEKCKLIELTQSLHSFGEKAQICYPFDIRGVEFISIGSNVFIGPRVLLGADENARIDIEDYVMFGPNVSILAGDHRYDLVNTEICLSGAGKRGNVIIKRGAWIGAYTVILKNVIIGEGAVIGAGSVVTKSVPANEIWAGNPARFVKKRFKEN